MTIHPAQLEEIRARVANPLPLDNMALNQALADREKLLAEVDTLRTALAGHLFDGESLTTREAVRSGMITMGLTAYDALRGVKDLLADIATHENLEGCAVDLRTNGGWVDVKDRLNEILAKADPSPAPRFQESPARRSK